MLSEEIKRKIKVLKKTVVSSHENELIIYNKFIVIKGTLYKIHVYNPQLTQFCDCSICPPPLKCVLL